MEDVPPKSPGSLAAQRAPPVASGHSTTAALLPTQSPTSSVLPHQLHGAPSSNVFVTEFGMAQSSLGRGGPFYMNAMAAAVPHAGYQPPYGVAMQPHHGFYPLYPGASTPPQLFQSPQYAIHNIPVPNPAYYQQQGPTVSQYHPIQVYQPQPPPESSQTRQSGWYGQGQMSPASYAYPPTAVYYCPTNAPFAAPVPPPPPPPQMPIHNAPVPPSVDPRTAPPPIAAGSSGHGLSYPTRRPPRPKTGIAEPDTMDSRQTVPRGPPRRPKQREYAIWIGNLPPRTDLMSLVNHVCKEAPGLESLFLISKSNCAFANFKDEQTCISAQQKLHDSRFQTVRLVSRLRKSAVERPGVLTPVNDGPTNSSSSSVLASDSPACEPDVKDATGTSTPASSLQESNLSSGIENVQGKEQYFILKSLTIEDLEVSVRSGIWATQSHNEETLNAAFKASDQVYLIFSANKSGEYFGYARMTSSINEDPEAAIEFAPAAQTSGALDLPKAIPTDASHLAPKGRIIDDSARGTIFWEVGRDDDDSGDEENGDGESVADAEGDEESATPKSWGKPFALEWMSTTRVPFYRTRGLRNPWNANREVKIARDGTELEPNVGRRLVSLFNATQSPGILPPGVVRPGSGRPTG